jgi:hypothetical protein
MFEMNFCQIHISLFFQSLYAMLEQPPLPHALKNGKKKEKKLER